MIKRNGSLGFRNKVTRIWKLCKLSHTIHCIRCTKAVYWHTVGSFHQTQNIHSIQWMKQWLPLIVNMEYTYMLNQHWCKFPLCWATGKFDNTNAINWSGFYGTITETVVGDWLALVMVLNPIPIIAWQVTRLFRRLAEIFVRQQMKVNGIWSWHNVTSNHTWLCVILW